MSQLYLTYQSIISPCDFLSNTVSPHNILKSHFIQLVDAITVPNKLATHLSKANLIAGAVERKVKTTPNLDDYDKASLLVNEVLKSLKVFNDPETLSQFCDVLKKQEDPDLKRIADIMLDELGKYYVYVDLITCITVLIINNTRVHIIFSIHSHIHMYLLQL